MNGLLSVLLPRGRWILSRGVRSQVAMLGLAGAVRAMAEPAALPEGPTGAAWAASWITHPTASLTDYGVFHFRKRFELAAVPARFVIHVSGDNRYRLFVNGTSVCTGPARGDLLHWRYETVDLAPFLHAGENVLAATVWNFGPWRPVALIGLRTGLIVQGHSAAEAVVDTDESWRVIRDDAIAPLPLDRAKLNTYIVVGPGDEVDGAKYPWGWEKADYDDRAWLQPRLLGHGLPHGFGTEVYWWLVPRPIPLPEETALRIPELRRCEGVPAGTGFLTGGAPLVVPPHTAARLLLDQTFETSAYPQLVVSGGRGSDVTLTYAEALVDEHGAKGNRNDIAGRHIVGVRDRFEPDGGARRLFSTLDYRTYRYVEMAIRTQDEALTVDDLHGVFTGYPFQERARFASDDPELAQIWRVGWRTARLCAFETYMDCPYYERLQYAGDTRIQALISLYVSGDDRLMRNAIEQFDESRIPEGLTQSRYPNSEAQVVPPFSLWWIGMVHDYWLHRDDPAFIAARLGGVEAVLGWFERHVDPRTGMLGALPYWNFVDWADEWAWTEAQPGGQPPGAVEGGSSILTLHLAWALDDAADLCGASGHKGVAQRYRTLAEKLRTATMARCWDDGRRLVADTPAKKTFSQHADILAVLSGAVPPADARELITRVANDRSLTQCTQYFRFYLGRALVKAGCGDDYLKLLQPWRDMLARGLTTFAEKADPTRSDCHAWSASPNYELLATVCGIGPGSPGFKTVRIEPHPGALRRIEGAVPHPDGLIEVRFEHDGDRLRGTVTLPAALTGTLVWHGQPQPLHGGEQAVRF